MTSQDTLLVDVINRSPEAEFTFTPNNPSIQDQVNITDTSSDFDGTIVFWFWDFGDGNTSDLQAPTYKYATYVDYNVTLTVKDDENAISTYTKTLSVDEAPNQDVVPL